MDKEDKWKKILTKEQFEIFRKKATEKPFTGKLLKEKRKGIYVCAACRNRLFSSNTKFDSGTGWPSFYDVVSKGNVKLKREKGLFMRIEVLCSKCGGHLGHVFDDTPKTPTGKRYCINSGALKFEKN